LVRGSARSHANAAAQQALIGHWQSIVKSLSNFLKTLSSNYVSNAFVYMFLQKGLVISVQQLIF